MPSLSVVRGLVREAVDGNMSRAPRELKHELPDGTVESRTTGREFTHVASSTGHALEPLAGHGKRRVVSWHGSHAGASKRGREMQQSGWSGVLVEPIRSPPGHPAAPVDPDAPGGTTPPDPSSSDEPTFGPPPGVPWGSGMMGGSRDSGVGNDDLEGPPQPFRNGPSDPSDAGDGSAVTEAALDDGFVAEASAADVRAAIVRRDLSVVEGASMDWVSEASLSAAAREKAAEQDEAMPGGSFPIRSVAELKKAIRAVGRAKDVAAARAWIIKRAKQLKQVSLLPGAWGVQESVLEVVEGFFDEALHPRGRGGKWVPKPGDHVHIMSGDSKGVLLHRVVSVEGNHAIVQTPRRPSLGGGATKTVPLSDLRHAPAPPAGHFDASVRNVSAMSADDKIKAYEQMHGRSPSAAQLKKLRGVKEAVMDVLESAQTAALAVTHAPIGKGGKNWITASKPGNKGEIPAYLQNIRNAIMRNGTDESSATAIAVGRARDWAEGKGKVSAEVRAAAAKAIAEWDAMRAKAKAT